MGKRQKLPVLLPVVVTLACLLAVLARAFWPAVVLPRLDVPNMTGLSLLALVVESWWEKLLPRRDWLLTALAGAGSFGLLPLCAGVIPGERAPLLALLGAVVFSVTTALFTLLRARISGEKGRIWGVLAAGVILFLACQGFGGMVL